MEKNPSQSIRITRKAAINFKKNHFEKEAWTSQTVICGIDEVGRGCLAGPLVTAAVILPLYTSYKGLKDSKLLTPIQREQACLWIKNHAWYATGIISPYLIDKHNIWNATLLCMKRALLHLLTHYPGTPQAIVVDAMPLDLKDTCYFSIPVHSFPDGERKSSSIAAASIVAKVTRDALMGELHKVFPGYSLDAHKGYATGKHREALLTKGQSIIHRERFIKEYVSSHLSPEVQGTIYDFNVPF